MNGEIERLQQALDEFESEQDLAQKGQKLNECSVMNKEIQKGINGDTDNYIKRSYFVQKQRFERLEGKFIKDFSIIQLFDYAKKIKALVNEIKSDSSYFQKKENFLQGSKLVDKCDKILEQQCSSIQVIQILVVYNSLQDSKLKKQIADVKNIVIEFEEEKLNFEELEKYKKSTKMSYGNSILSNNKYNQSFAEKKESQGGFFNSIMKFFCARDNQQE